MIRIDLRENIDPSILSGRATKLEKAMTWQIMKDTRPFVPAMTMSLNNRTYIQGNSIVYPAPYARYLYYGVKMVDAATGRPAFYINDDIGFRFHRGAKLRPTSEPLHISTAVHKDATSQWIEASKARNMEQWKKVAARIYTNGK